MNEVDDDGSGFIEFGEFIKIIKNGKRNKKDGPQQSEAQLKIYEFFHKLA